MESTARKEGNRQKKKSHSSDPCSQQVAPNQRNDDPILVRCRYILDFLVKTSVLRSWATELQLYVLAETELPDYDGITHFEDNERVSRIGLRIQGQGEQPYKPAAVVGTFLHELAHCMDGYRHNGKLAHSASFYRHYGRIMASVTRANLFQLPRAFSGNNPKTLQRFDDLSPFSDVLGNCLPSDESDVGEPPSPEAPQSGPVRVTLRHWKSSSMEKVATIDNKNSTGSLYSRILKVFRQKFPKFSPKIRYEFQITNTKQGSVTIVTDGCDAKGCDCCFVLYGGERITCLPLSGGSSQRESRG